MVRIILNQTPELSIFWPLVESPITRGRSGSSFEWLLLVPLGGSMRRKGQEVGQWKRVDERAEAEPSPTSPTVFCDTSEARVCETPQHPSQGENAGQYPGLHLFAWLLPGLHIDKL